MTTLLLRLAGPLQSWGTRSRFTRRLTDAAPSKSGVIGLLAAARGLRRTDPIEDMLDLRFGVRVDQPGRVERDFQIARPAVGKPLPLTDRFYLTDAVFVAGVEGDESLVTGLDEAIRNPVFPPYLGRRSCPPAGPIALGARESDLWTALRDESWQAALWWRRKQAQEVSLEMRIDAAAVPGSVDRSSLTATTEHDAPMSFDPEFRRYAWREVLWGHVEVDNPDGRARSFHDPFALLGGS